METIIGLLVVILPIVFRLIGKKLEQAGQMQQPSEHGEAPIEDWTETLKRYMEQQSQMVEPEEQWSPETVQAEPDKKTQTVVKPRKVSPILIEEKPKKKEKIDVKKMIVYSEIMKPKYTEK